MMIGFCNCIGISRKVAYINFNFPINPPSLTENSGNIPVVFSPVIKNPLNTIDLPPDSKDLILLFGRLAEEVYPETLEQSNKKGEGYSWKILGEPQSIAARINRQVAAIEPKWTKIFHNPSSDKIARFQFQARVGRLPFKWPIFVNQTVVESHLYSSLVEQNSQTFETARIDPAGLEAWLLEIAGGDKVVAASLAKSIAEYERMGHVFGIIRKIKALNRSATRALLHKLSMNEEVSRRVFEAFFDSVLGPDKKYFSKEEFSHGIGRWKGAFSDGEIPFDTFVEEVRKHLPPPVQAPTGRSTGKSIRTLLGGLLGGFGRRNQAS